MDANTISGRGEPGTAYVGVAAYSYFTRSGIILPQGGAQSVCEEYLAN
jgi:hypothetical protein